MTPSAIQHLRNSRRKGPHRELALISIIGVVVVVVVISTGR